MDAQKKVINLTILYDYYKDVKMCIDEVTRILLTFQYII